MLGYEVRRVVTAVFRVASGWVGREAKRCNILCYRYHDILILCHCVTDIMIFGYCAIVLQILH